MATHSTLDLPVGIMNRQTTKRSWNEMITKLKQGFADFAEDDMLFSEAKDTELIRKLEHQLKRSGIKRNNY